jgi:hypothetical protein
MVALLPKPRDRGMFSVTEQEKGNARRHDRLKNQSAASETIRG